LKINDDEIEIVAGLFGWEAKTEMEVCRQLLADYALQMLVLPKAHKVVMCSPLTKHLLNPHPWLK